MFASPGFSTPSFSGRLLWCWAGALTASSFTVVADTNRTDAARIVVSSNSDLSAPAFVSDYVLPLVSSGIVASYRTLRFNVSGLTAATKYYYQVQFRNAPDNDPTVRSVTTAPIGAAAFTFATASCSHIDPGVSPYTILMNSTVHRAMVTDNPLLFVHLDDIVYSDITSLDMAARDQNARLYCQSVDVDVLNRTVPIAYIPGDHDTGPNDSSLDTANGEVIFRNARTAFREVVPYYPFVQQTLGETNIDHVILTQQFDIAKTRFLLLDCTCQSRNGVTALGIGAGNGDYWDQLTWLGTALNQATIDGVAWLFLCLPRGWTGYNQTCFNDVYTGERQSISDLIENCATPVCLIVGDSHCAGFDDGTNCASHCTDGFGGFPQMQASGLFNQPLVDVGVYSWNGSNTFVGKGGVHYPEDGQYVIVTMSSDNKSWAANIKGVPIDPVTFAPTTLKSVSSADATPAVSFNNAAPSVAHGSPLSVNLDKTWFGACSVHWASSDGQSGNVSFLPNKKRASFAITFVSAGSPTITLSSPSGCTISGTNPATVTVS